MLHRGTECERQVKTHQVLRGSNIVVFMPTAIQRGIRRDSHRQWIAGRVGAVHIADLGIVRARAVFHLWTPLWWQRHGFALRDPIHLDDAIIAASQNRGLLDEGVVHTLVSPHDDEWITQESGKKDDKRHSSRQGSHVSHPRLA